MLTVKLLSPAVVLRAWPSRSRSSPVLRGPRQAAERVVTVALAHILFEGGMHLGCARFRSVLAPSSAYRPCS